MPTASIPAATVPSDDHSMPTATAMPSHSATAMPPHVTKVMNHLSANSSMYSAFWVLLILLALYMSFKCNKGFDIFGAVGAVCYPVCYIAYKGAVGNCFNWFL